MKRIKELFFSWQFITFVLIGCVNSLSGIVFSWLYSSTLDQISAFIAGYTTGILVSYLLNSYFTFKEKLQFVKLIKFAFSCLPNFLIQLTVVYIGVQIIGVHKLIAYIAAAAIGVPVTFFILKLFVFIKK